MRKWASKEHVTAEMFLETIDDLENNLSSADLGSGLFKVRMARQGEGKSGGYRTLIVFRAQDRAIVVFGYKKSQMENLSEGELRQFKKLSKDLPNLSTKEISEAIAHGVLHEINQRTRK